MSKVYIITYNPTEPFRKDVFHSYIQSMYSKRFISDWWHHIDETYLIVSHLSPTELYNLIFPGIPQRYLLILEVNLNNSQGWLPPKAWEWINKYKTLK